MRWVKIALIFLIGWLIISGSATPLLANIADKNWVSHYLYENGTKGHIMLIGATLLFVAIGGPRQVNSLIFGYFYGAYYGMLIALVVSVLAATINYFLAQFLFAKTLFRYFPKRIRKFQNFCSRNPFHKILLLRLFPIGSNLLTNSLSGCIRVPFVPFILASALGYLPQIVIFVLIGTGLESLNNNMIYLSIALLVVSMLLTGLLYRDHIKYKIESLKQDNTNECS